MSDEKTPIASTRKLKKSINDYFEGISHNLENNEETKEDLKLLSNATYLMKDDLLNKMHVQVEKFLNLFDDALISINKEINDRKEKSEKMRFYFKSKKNYYTNGITFLKANREGLIFESYAMDSSTKKVFNSNRLEGNTIEEEKINDKFIQIQPEEFYSNFNKEECFYFKSRSSKMTVCDYFIKIDHNNMVTESYCSSFLTGKEAYNLDFLNGVNTSSLRLEKEYTQIKECEFYSNLKK